MKTKKIEVILYVMLIACLFLLSAYVDMGQLQDDEQSYEICTLIDTEN